MNDSSDQGGEAPCWAHLLDELDLHPAPPALLASNTIIYCADWVGVVAFYRDGLGLAPTMERDWFVEFELHPGAHLSVADVSRATITASTGAGVTLSWSVGDIDALHSKLAANQIDVSAIQTRWESRYFLVFDPAGNRIEFWSAGPETA